MQSEQISVNGRELLVKFTCGRCGATEYLPYRDSPAHGVSVNLRSCQVPDGWLDASGTLPLLCHRCHAELKIFMRNIEEVK